MNKIRALVWMVASFGACVVVGCSGDGSPAAGSGGSGGSNPTAMTAGSSGVGTSTGASGSGGSSSVDATGGTGGSGGSIDGTAGAGGAGSDTDAMVDAIDDGAPVDCASRPDVDGYRPNLTKAGQKGVLTFVLVESNPGPPKKGTNIWTFKVTRAGGATVTEGLSAVLDMPEHTHSVNVQPEISFDATLGAFKVEQIYAYLTGLWRLTFEVKEGPDGGGQLVDTVVFTFCI